VATEKVGKNRIGNKKGGRAVGKNVGKRAALVLGRKNPYAIKVGWGREKNVPRKGIRWGKEDFWFRLRGLVTGF